MAEDKAIRIGFLVDGDPGTDLMSALYEYDETGVRLHVPFLSHEDNRSRWWSRGTLHMDDPDRSKYSYEPPIELHYFDNEGSVALLGCVSGGANTNLGRGVGRGTIRARYALEGAHAAADFVKLNGLQSEILGLGYWLAYSAHNTSIKRPRNGGPVEVTTTMGPVDAVRLGRPLNLKAIARGTAPGGWSPEAAYRSKVFIETFSKTSKDWEDHLPLHFAMRNLIRVASWRPINFESHRAASLKETVDIKGKTHQRLRDVRTATTGIVDGTWKASNKFLLLLGHRYARDLPLAETRRGVRARHYTVGGAVGPRRGHGRRRYFPAGHRYRRVGYQALIESGKTPAAANGTRVAERIDHLLAEIAGNLTFADEAFAQDFADSYNSVKHANRAPVAPDLKLTHFYQGVELLRVWIALRLGVAEATLGSRRN